MFEHRKLIACSQLLAKVIFASSIFLWPVENVFATANLNLDTTFIPVQSGRTYMDVGGTWDGNNDAAGDTFRFTINNTGPDPAYDLRDLTVDIPSGFVLGQVSVPVSDSPVSCSNINGINANQTGSTQITIGIPSNTNIAANCSYRFDLVLTTNSTVAPNPAHSVTFNGSYNEVNNNNSTQQFFSDSESIAVRAGALSLTKTTAASNPPDNTIVGFDVVIRNTGSGGLFDVRLSDVLGPGLINLNIIPPASPSGSFISASDYEFDYIPGGTTVSVLVQARTDIDPASSTCPTLTNTASVIDRTAIVVPDASASIPFDLAALSVSHVSTSRCVLCGTGTVTLRLTNTSAVDLNNIVIREELLASELRVINSTSMFAGAPIANPSRSGTEYTWNLGAAVTVPANSSRDLVFDVTYDTTLGINEDLARNNTTIQATVDYALSCGIAQPTVNDFPYLLVLDQPEPQVTKQGRNVDAGQSAGQYTDTVYGHRDDDVIWRVRIQNNGPVNMQDVVLDDTITGNFDIKYVCNSEANATAAAAGSPPGAPSCQPYADVSTVLNFRISDPFGNVPGSDDISAGGVGEIYYVGKIKTSCGVTSNTVNIEWGCDVDGTLGGLASADIFAGGTVDTDSANLSSQGSGALSGSSITHTIRGVDGGAEAGSRGVVTIRVENDTGGTIRGVEIDDILPAEYVVDTTAPITFTFDPAYGNNYGGVADAMTHNIDLSLANILTNTNLHFVITSNGDVGDNVRDFDLFRHGDVFTISYQIVLIDSAHFDRAADIDRTPEDATNTTIAPTVPTDPDNTFTINNDLTITYDDTCTFTANQVYHENRAFPVDVEDLDVTMSSAIYVVTNTAPVDLQVNVTNNGGHVAQNFFIYVVFGDAMRVITPAPGCNLVTPSIPLPRPEWNVPDAIFNYQNVYACSDQTGMAAINPGQTRQLVFTVEKDAAAVNDDLTFRADVNGEITLFDGTPLTDLDGAASTGLDLVTIITSTADGKSITPVAHNYSRDVFRSRVIGFNLTKVQSGLCSEDANVPVSGDSNLIIGEECNYHIESGGWFGFDTPGFALIAVKDIMLRDDLPNGQGYIDHSTTIIGGTTPADEGVIFDPVPADFNKVTPDAGGITSLNETDIDWFFNTEADGSPGITKKDKWFHADVRTRLLNDAVDNSAAGPNLHASTSTDVARASFDAVFDTVTIFVDENQNIPGFPTVSVRQVDMTVTEPDITVVKEVCNESLHGFGTGCSNFTTLANDGDTNDSYIYKITLTNQASSSGVTRAPAYNVISTDTLDASDLMLIADFSSDGLDNDGDGMHDANGGDPDGESTISENVVLSGGPAVITVSSTHSAPLLRVDPGASVTFYYRVDPDDTIAPLQTLTNTVAMSYDSLDGAFGNQSVPQISNTGAPAIGRARLYNTAPVIASVQMTPVLTQPKTIVRLSNTAPGSSPQAVVVGEEIEYQLQATLPVANLRNFVIRDELPPGIRCIEGQTVNLNAAPYSAAGFVPGGTFAPGCTSTGSNDFVEWNFGDQAVTLGAPGTTFNFPVTFIARVENTALTTDGAVISNGDPSTVATTSYVNDSGNTITLAHGSVDVVVREPLIELTKSFAVANSDAADELTVTVTATNNGTAAAYNLRVLDDLIGTDLTYIGNLSGTDPPDNVDVVILGAGRPVFSWDNINPDFEIAPGAVKTFTFDVRVDTAAQPLETLDNTIEGIWDSIRKLDIAGVPTALNASGAIGADGSTLGLRNGVLPNAGDAINDYEATDSASTSVLPLTLNKTDLSPGVTPTIGAHKNFQIEITLPEGTTSNLAVSDNLNFSGLSYVLAHNADFDVTYDFLHIATINGAVPAESAFNAFPAVDAAGSLLWDIGTVVTSTEDDSAGNTVNPVIRINYFARVNNDLVTDDSDTLQNSVTLNYTNGEDATTEVITDTTLPETVVEPLLTVSKTVTNLTSGAGPTGVGDDLEFQLTISNTGNSTAFDVNIVDTLPAELQLDLTTPPTALINAVPVAGFIATPSGAPAGPLIWGRGNTPADNSLDIPAGQSLVLTYHTTVQSATPNTIISNSAMVDWTSLDDTDASSAYERTGAGCPTITVPNDYCAGPAVTAVSTGAPTGLLKQNPADLNASIGEEFTYIITVPATPQPTALHDVQILDDLSASAADIVFVSVSKVSPSPGVNSQPWIPENIGAPNNLIIADRNIGIDIPATEQIKIAITVALANTIPPAAPAIEPNESGLTFNNSATYNFNLINNNDTTRTPGSGNTTPVMTVVEPELTLDKRGPVPPATVQFGIPVPYTLVVENTGTGPAFDTTVLDKLPAASDNPPVIGGMCDAIPQVLSARITTAADETTVVRALARGTDYTVSYTAAPTCELVITTLTDHARIESAEKLIVSYEAYLDAGSQSAAELTNIAGVTQWFSLDTSGAGATGEIREYTRAISDGTTALVDHEDAFTVIAEAPAVDIQKTVVHSNDVNGDGFVNPGDTLSYTIIITNTGIVDATGIFVSDAIPANTIYVANSTTVNAISIADPSAGVSPLVAGIDVSSSDLTPPLPTAGNGTITVGETATLTFDVVLDPVITSGTIIENQATVTSPATGALPSDDPNVNGDDDPFVTGDEDPTQTVVISAPAFQVQKTSQDITGNTSVLEAGDSLRYTITVKNIGQENAVNVLLTDQIPANTVYVSNSTTMNGVAVADPAAGASALEDGLLINAPENTTAGFMRADTDASANNVATITFDIVINNSVVDGAVISNQGFVSGDGEGSGVFPQQPSDDPNTPLPDDPTLDVVGNVPLVDVLKTVTISNDVNGNGFVDAGDTLRYTVTATNFGGIPATGVTLLDDLGELNTTKVMFVPGSLNIISVPAGADTSNTNPNGGVNGTGLLDVRNLFLDAVGGVNAIDIIFDAVVDAAAVSGDIISNQASVSSNETPAERSDFDGIDANGDQPTTIVVGNEQRLAITKQVFVVGGGVATAGGELEYVVRVTNIGSVPASDVVITDYLDLPVAGQKTYVAGSGLLNGLVSGVGYAAPVVSADYSAVYGDLPPAGTAELRFRVLLDPALAIGDTVSNTGVVRWDVPASTASASVDIGIGGTPGESNLNGRVWHDTDFNNTPGASETLLQDWRVELYRNNVLLASTQTDTNGVFQFGALPPNLPAGGAYELRYISPGAGASSATLGTADSVFTNGPQRITDIFAASGASLQNLNMPRQPNGIIYDSVLRLPVAGARLSMVNQTRSNQLVPASCFDDPNHQNQVTAADGFYKFDLNFSDSSSCAEGHEYVIQVQPPANGYVGTTSVIIPPLNPVTGTAQDVPNCPGNTAVDQVPATTQHCENSASPVQPDTSVEPATAATGYYLKFLFNNALYTDQIYNNHIAIDPELDNAVAISKVAGMQNVTRSQLVPYTITLQNIESARLSNLSVIDNFPAGFKYVAGSSRIDGVEVEPQINGNQLSWPGINLNTDESRTIKLLLVVGSGVSEGEYVNTAHVLSPTGGPASGIASATVRVIPDPAFDCTDIIGKVFDDKNNNGYQDDAEPGLPGVQLATARGLRVTTDKHGRFHITCAVVANEVRGSNFIMKLDDRTLPSGYRVTTENPRVLRATRGKMLKFNFGATIHRVVRLDLADGVFEKGSTRLRPQWRSRIDLLVIELQKDPSILRLSYLGENETEAEVEDRLNAIEKIISDRWQEIDCCYKLTIEKEVFWRKGNPSDREAFE